MPADSKPREGIERRKICLALLPAMLLPTLSSLFYFVLFKEATVAKPIYIATKIFTILWPILATLWIFRQRVSLSEGNIANHRGSSCRDC